MASAGYHKGMSVAKEFARKNYFLDLVFLARFGVSFGGGLTANKPRIASRGFSGCRLIGLPSRPAGLGLFGSAFISRILPLM